MENLIAFLIAFVLMNVAAWYFFNLPAVDNLFKRAADWINDRI